MTGPRSPRWRRGLAIAATALAAAAFAIAFRATLAVATRALGGDDIVAMIEHAAWWQRIALPVAGGLAVAGIAHVARSFREGAGVGFVMEAIVLGRIRVPLSRSIAQAVSSWIAIA